MMYLCCKCFEEFDDSEGACPVCDFPVCGGDCSECNKQEAAQRCLMAEAMTKENPFIQVRDGKEEKDRDSRLKKKE